MGQLPRINKYVVVEVNERHNTHIEFGEERKKII